MIATVVLVQAKSVKQAAGLMKAIQPCKYRAKMKVPPLIRTFLPVAMISVAATLPAHAQTIANALTNGNFETNTAGTGQVKTGFTSNLSGFQDISTPVSGEDSGVQYGPAKPANTGGAGQVAESGNYFAFERGGDPGAFQITGTTLTAGQQLTLTWYAANSYLAPVQEVGILTATSTTSTFAAASQVAVANGSTNATYALPAYTANPGPYFEYSLTYTATAADAGKNVGIFFENIGPTGDYINTDNYDLAIAVPEPGTFCLVIMGMMGGALLVIRRRKQTLSRNLCA